LESPPEDDGAAVEQGVTGVERFGTPAVGEVTNSLAGVNLLARRGFAGRVFHEVFGVEEAPLERRLADLPRIVEENVGVWPTADLKYAPSPHTLYTTHAAVVRRLVCDARGRAPRVCLHV